MTKRCLGFNLGCLALLVPAIALAQQPAQPPVREITKLGRA